MRRAESRPVNFLLVLLAGALTLSLVLNGFLLYSRPEPLDYSEQQETETDLRLTQRLLAHCQASHQQQDSLLMALRAQNAASATATQ
ncbi:hypothetical protein GO988_07270 [Hymenobacter sp. HMF4947]|uniref:Uncharacterized protein n=1 Tax=Hymenobacter ginkgonis TaxID=2682976 RepID=A0A7K1TD61_9BACT|nr:hypothetical protein [Hymenobacter ginkgonis]MVN76121.1 hypothetical protein [Hymenobacter ginkgonis]